MNHYVYKIEDKFTGEFYFGSRSCKCSIYNDDYMGSPYAWNPDVNNLKKNILGSFNTRERAIEMEALLIESQIDWELNRNYYIPNKGFHTVGLTYGEEHRDKMSKITKRRWKDDNYRRKLVEKRKRWWETASEEKIKKRNEKIGKAHLGLKRTEETCKKISESKYKKVMHISTGNVYKSRTEASKYFDIDRRRISDHCNGKVSNPEFKDI